MTSRREVKVSEEAIEPWLFRVSSHPEESFGHFLGRFRRANHLKSHHLSVMLGLKYHAVAYWEAPSRRRRPSAKDLRVLSRLTGVDVAQLGLMFSSEGTRLYLRTRICPLCYGEAPFHKVTWQDANNSQCDQHQCELLSACPQCGNDFQLPSYWVDGQCDRCYLPFRKMNALERSVE